MQKIIFYCWKKFRKCPALVNRSQTSQVVVPSSLAYVTRNPGEMPVEITLAAEQHQKQGEDEEEPEHLVSPGDVITRDAGVIVKRILELVMSF